MRDFQNGIFFAVFEQISQSRLEPILIVAPDYER